MHTINPDHLSFLCYLRDGGPRKANPISIRQAYTQPLLTTNPDPASSYLSTNNYLSAELTQTSIESLSFESYRFIYFQSSYCFALVHQLTLGALTEVVQFLSILSSQLGKGFYIPIRYSRYGTSVINASLTAIRSSRSSMHLFLRSQ